MAVTSEPACHHDSTPQPAALQAHSPLSDPNTLDDESDRVGVAWTHERQAWAAASHRQIGMIRLPRHVCTTQYLGNLEFDLSCVIEDVVALTQFPLVQSGQQSMKKRF